MPCKSFVTIVAVRSIERTIDVEYELRYMGFLKTLNPAVRLGSMQTVNLD